MLERICQGKAKAVLLGIAAAAFCGFAANRSSGEEGKEKQGAEKKGAAEGKKEEAAFIRVRRDPKREPIALDTVIAHFTSGEGEKKVEVDLVGAVHIAEKKYYEELNKRFAGYEAVLFELVAPEGTKIPKGGRDGGLGNIQAGMADMLDLDFQLYEVDYTAKNFVHADMSPEQFAESMNKKGESLWKMFFRALGAGAAMQAKDPARYNDMAMLAALFAKDRPMRLKRLMADQFEDMETAMLMFDGPDGSTIVTERNKKALEVLKKELAAGKKRIAIFYGAAHLPDMAERLEKEFALKRTGEDWLEAWSLRSPAKQPGKEPAKEADKEPAKESTEKAEPKPSKNQAEEKPKGSEAGESVPK